MKAWLLDSLNGIDKLRLAEVGEPVPSAGEAVLELEFAALNPADRYMAEGQYPGKPKLPHILGRDGIGTVSAIGDGVKNIQIGQRMLILRGDTGVIKPGSFAEKVAVAAESLVVPPNDWSIEESAGAPLVYLTAYQALTQWGELPPSIVLISGASGGVGVASIQLARALGHRVIALSRSEKKKKTLLELGAELVFDPTQSDWPKKVKEAISPGRVNLAVDNIGGEMFSQILETLGDHGRVSVVGRLAGPVPQFNTSSLFFRRLRIGGVAVGAYKPAESQEAWDSVVKLMAKIGAKPLVDHIFEFEQLPAAFARLHDGPMGKVLLRIV